MSNNSNYQKSMDFIHTKSNTQFYQDLINEEKVMQVNGSPMSRGVWNLIVSKRDLTMWVKRGMKPHRGWKVTDVKRYYGLKGSGQKLLDNFLELKGHVDTISEREVVEEKTNS